MSELKKINNFTEHLKKFYSFKQIQVTTKMSNKFSCTMPSVTHRSLARLALSLMPWFMRKQNKMTRVLPWLKLLNNFLLRSTSRCRLKLKIKLLKKSKSWPMINLFLHSKTFSSKRPWWRIWKKKIRKLTIKLLHLKNCSTKKRARMLPCLFL